MAMVGRRVTFKLNKIAWKGKIVFEDSLYYTCRLEGFKGHNAEGRCQTNDHWHISKYNPKLTIHSGFNELLLGEEE